MSVIDKIDNLLEKEKFPVKLIVKVDKDELGDLPGNIDFLPELENPKDKRNKYEYIRQEVKGKEIIFYYGKPREASMKELEKVFQKNRKHLPSLKFDID